MTGIMIPRKWVGYKHPETSHAMQRKALSKQGTFRRAIYDLLMVEPMTDEELALALARKDHHVSACRRGLVIDGFVVATPVTRKTTSNNDATVWKAVRQ